MRMDGFDELHKRLRDLTKKAQELNGEHQVPLAELLTSSFLSKHTRFSSADDLFRASGFKVQDQDDLVAIPGDRWDEFIRSVSHFENWKAMLGEATKEWTARRLGFTDV
jgi:hypothetical protein